MTSDLLTFIQDHEEAFKSRNRLASLYSDFHYQKHTNPDGYAANIRAWKGALTRAAKAGVIPPSKEKITSKAKQKKSESSLAEGEGRGEENDVLCIGIGEELVAALEVQAWGRPMALGLVIGDAVARKEMIPLDDFQSSKISSIYSRNWVPSPWQVIQWSLRQLGVLGTSGEGEVGVTVGRFVVVENVEGASNAILRLQNKLHQTSISSIYSLATFTTTFSPVLNPSSPALSTIDISILLKYMSRDKPNLSYSQTTQTIKFAPPNTSAPPEITENDVSIASIKTLLQSLEQSLKPMETRLSELEVNAREAVSKKQRNSALAFLRRKKLIEGTLDKRRSDLLQLEGTLQKIEEASDNVEIVQAMKMSTSVLRSLNEQVGGVEGVESVTDALREEMERGGEISHIVAEPGADAVDENEVDEEFEALAREERAKLDAAAKADKDKREAEEAVRTRQNIEDLEKFEREKAESVGEELIQDSSTTNGATREESKKAVEYPASETGIPQ